MGNSNIVRVSTKAKQTIEELAKKSGEPMLSVIDKAVEAYRRRVILEETNRAYQELRADENASGEFDAELSEWDATLEDGLQGQPPPRTARSGARGKK